VGRVNTVSHTASVIERAWELRQRGRSQAQIAAIVGVGQSTVSRWLDELERRELARLSDRIGREKVRQTYVLEHLCSEALFAWERSKLPLKRVRSRKAGRVGGGASVDLVDVEERDGDPVFLEVAMRALDGIRDVWGLNVAPRRSGASSFDAEEFTYAAVAKRLKERAGEG
jgi:DNA-binding transcriptional ArsR family regulator